MSLQTLLDSVAKPQPHQCQDSWSPNPSYRRVDREATDRDQLAPSRYLVVQISCDGSTGIEIAKEKETLLGVRTDHSN